MNATVITPMVSYRMAMSLAEEMLVQGLITAREYDKIDRMIAQDRGLSLCSISCRKPLIINGLQGNMTQTKGGDQRGTDST